MTEEAASRTPADTKLLLIDEDPSARALASSVLSTLFPVSGIEEVGQSTEFFHALKNDSYDIIVTELGMKWAHWLFLFEAIRALQPTASIVVFTNDDDRESALAALNAGASEYVVKSSRGFLNLTQAVDKVLIGRPQRTEPAPAVEVSPAGDTDGAELVFKPEIPPDPEPIAEAPAEKEGEGEAVAAEPNKEDTAPVSAPLSGSTAAGHFDGNESPVDSILAKIRISRFRHAHPPAPMDDGEGEYWQTQSSHRAPARPGEAATVTGRKGKYWQSRSQTAIPSRRRRQRPRRCRKRPNRCPCIEAKHR